MAGIGGDGKKIVADLAIRDVTGVAIVPAIPISQNDVDAGLAGIGLHYMKTCMVFNVSRLEYRVFKGCSEIYNQPIENDSGYIHMTTRT